MPISETNICNQALLKNGAKPAISHITEASDNARLCNAFYASVRDAVLRSHPWNCAIERKALTALSAAPLMDYDHQYQLPANPWCLRVLQVGAIEDQPTRWRVEGRLLLTDENSPKIVYIKRITDTNEFDPLLIDVLVLKLSLKMAMPLTSSLKMQTALIEEVETVSLPEARSIDGQESSVQRIQTTEFINSRF
jgi:hypothetical protein